MKFLQIREGFCIDIDKISYFTYVKMNEYLFSERILVRAFPFKIDFSGIEFEKLRNDLIFTNFIECEDYEHPEVSLMINVNHIFSFYRSLNGRIGEISEITRVIMTNGDEFSCKSSSYELIKNKLVL